MARNHYCLGKPGGCGKSMFCCILAEFLPPANKRQSLSMQILPLPCFPSGCLIEFWSRTLLSEGVLSSLDINSALIAERVAVLKDYPFIGVMGYAAGETPFSYPELKYDRIKLLISEASRLVDYIILDCNFQRCEFLHSLLQLNLPMWLCESPHTDLRGINYLKAHKPLLTDAKFRYDEHLTFAGLALTFHALDGMGRQSEASTEFFPMPRKLNAAVHPERCSELLPRVTSTSSIP